MVAKIFISYSSKDRKFARTICTALESRGLSCWIASRDVGPGESFMDAIVQAISTAKVMVLVFSENANNSDEIKREVVLAGNAKVAVIPVRVEDVVPTGAFAYQFATRQWIDLFDDWENQIERLATWISGILAPGSMASAATADALLKAGVQTSIHDASLIAPDAPTTHAKAVEDEAQRKKDEAEAQRLAEKRRQQEEADKRHADDEQSPKLAEAEAPRRAKDERRAHEAEAKQRSDQESSVAADQVPGAKSQQFSRRAVIGGIAAPVVIGGGALSYQMWRTRGLIRTFDTESSVKSVAFSPDGRSALSGQDDDNLNLWDIAIGGKIRTFTGGSGYKVYSVAFSPDTRTILSGSKTVKLWDLATGALIRDFSGNTESVRSVAFSPDGRTALSAASYEDAFTLWDVAKGAMIRTFSEVHNAPYNSVAFSPDGRTALAGGEFGELGLWDIATGAQIRKLGTTLHIILTVAFSADGRCALSGGGDEALSLWDLAKGSMIRILNGHTDMVTSVAFAPDGRTALSGSQDKTLKLWDLASGSTIRTFTGHTYDVNSVAIAPDGRTALSGSDDMTVKLWDLA